MRYAKILNCDCVNGPGWGVSLYTQGCPHHCPGCFNPETWDFKGGKLLTPIEKELILDLLDQPYITRFSLLGGEPLAKENRIELAKFLYDIRWIYNNDIKIWIWTGYTWEELLEEMDKEECSSETSKLAAILFLADVLVEGRFDESKKDLTLKWRGSSNQRIININESLMQDKIILYSD